MTERDRHPHPAIVAILKIAGVDPARVWTASEDETDEPPRGLMHGANAAISTGMQACAGGSAARPGQDATSADPDPADVARLVVRTLVEAARAGDEKAQRGLFELHARSAHAVARRLLGDSADAEDAVQDAFTEAFIRLDELAKPESFGSWLYRMVRNRSIDILRSRRGIPTDPGDLPEDGGGDANGDGAVPADVVVSDRETLAAVAAALESLTAEDARAIRLGASDMDGYDLAAELDVSDRAHAYVRLNRARRRLRNATGAVMLARHGLHCSELRRRLAGTGDSTELVRIVNRHAGRCEDCRRRRAVLLESPQLAHALAPYGAAHTTTTCSLRRRTARTARRVMLPLAVLVAILGLSAGIASENAPDFTPGSGVAGAATESTAGAVAPVLDGGPAIGADPSPPGNGEDSTATVLTSSADGSDTPSTVASASSQGREGAPGSGVPATPPPPVEAAPADSAGDVAVTPVESDPAPTPPVDSASETSPPPPPVTEISPPPRPPTVVDTPSKSIRKAGPPPVMTVAPPQSPTVPGPKTGRTTSP